MKEAVIKSVTRILDNYLEVTRHRKTPERYTILRAIYNHKGHFTLEELKDELAEKYTFPVSRATLYNTLNLFIEIRLVMRHHIQGITKYEAFYGNNNHCHQICTTCGKVTEINSPAIVEAVESINLKRFRKDGFNLYIYGVCSTCQAKLTRKRRQEQEKKLKTK
jgi:Fur family ferric uptake transcriptional regulator